MKLRLSNYGLTRYLIRNGYADSTQIPLAGDIGEAASALLAWMSGQLASGEMLTDVILEAAGRVATAFETTTETDEEGNEVVVKIPIEFRLVLAAAVSVQLTLPDKTLPRTFVASSEVLPAELRDGLLQAWAALNEAPENT
jgi:hypothetical protein